MTGKKMATAKSMNTEHRARIKKNSLILILLLALSLCLGACGESRDPVVKVSQLIDEFISNSSDYPEGKIYNIQLALHKIDGDTVPDNIEKFYSVVENYKSQYPLAPEFFKSTYSILSESIGKKVIKDTTQFEEYINIIGLQTEYEEAEQLWGKACFYTIAGENGDTIETCFKYTQNHGDYFSYINYCTSDGLIITNDIEYADSYSAGFDYPHSQKTYDLRETYQAVFENPGELLARIQAKIDAENNKVKVNCSICNGTGSVRYYYGSSDLEAILSGHDPYTVGPCTSCDGKGYTYEEAGGEKHNDSDVVCPSCYQWKNELITKQDVSGTNRTWCADCWADYESIMN